MDELETLQRERDELAKILGCKPSRILRTARQKIRLLEQLRHAGETILVRAPPPLDLKKQDEFIQATRLFWPEKS